MRTSLALLALVSAVVALPGYGSAPTTTSCTKSKATPTAAPPVDIPDTRNDGAATIYKAQNFKGRSSPTDYTALPTEIECLELSSLYGGWENKTRSLVVQEGYKCDFYTQPGCTSAPLCLIAKDGKKIEKKTLSKEFDKKIVSIKCEPWNVPEVVQPKPEPKPAPKPAPKPSPKPEAPTYGAPPSEY